MNSAVDT